MPAKLVPYRFPRVSTEASSAAADDLHRLMLARRSCRYFSPEPFPKQTLETAIAIAHSAPSGANRKPWRFVVVDDPLLKQQIRSAAEEEERQSYEHRMPKEWLDALDPIGTGPDKPFLEVAPYLVVLFRIDWEVIEGKKYHNYYPHESTGIAAGFFVMACHQIGLATLTHTPSPMGFLRDLLGRPLNEKPYLLIPVGYPAEDCMVPDLVKKPLTESLQWNRSA